MTAIGDVRFTPIDDNNEANGPRRGRRPNSRRQRNHVGDRRERLFPATEDSIARKQRAIETSEHIRQYFHLTQPENAADWLRLPEIPDPREINTIIENGASHVDKYFQSNRIQGAWTEGKNFYLQSQYQLLREDGISPLRDVVDEVTRDHYLLEKGSRNGARIYDNVSTLFPSHADI